MSRRLVLVLGGARSGKSRYAESLAVGWRGEKVYVATAEAGDKEMADRIARHRASRGAGWSTVEAPLELTASLDRLAGSFILVDCVTLWLSNLILAGHDAAAEVEALVAALSRQPATVVVVSNEVGLGIVPDNALARRFRDVAGLANQRLADVCDEVVFMAAGLPLRLKG